MYKRVVTMDINRFKDIMPLHRFSPFWGWNGKLDKAELVQKGENIIRIGCEIHIDKPKENTYICLNGVSASYAKPFPQNI